MNLNIVFFGTSRFAANILQYLIENQLNIVAVVTRPDKAKGRHLRIEPSPVKDFMQKFYPNIPILQPLKASTSEFINQVKTFSPILFIVAAYGEIIKKELLYLPPLGGINVHGSLLPKYRGAAPIQRCLMNGDIETGVTIMQMSVEMDAGNILETAKLQIGVQDTFGDLEKKLANLSSPLLVRVIQKFIEGKQTFSLQNKEEVTFAPKITLQETQIQWNKSALEIHNLIRALSPSPGAWCWILVDGEKKRLKIRKSEIIDDLHSVEPGHTLVLNAKEWIIACQGGGLSLLELQLEGRKVLSIQQFLQGLQNHFHLL